MARGDKRNYVAVFNGQRHPFEIVESGIMSLDEIQSRAERAVSLSGMTTPRNDPKAILVKIFAQHIVNGELAEREVCTKNVTPPLERMTQAEYEDEMKSILAVLPDEFRSFVSIDAWERGHSAGFEEVVSIANEMANKLKVCTKAFADNLSQRWETNSRRF